MSTPFVPTALVSPVVQCTCWKQSGCWLAALVGRSLLMLLAVLSLPAFAQETKKEEQPPALQVGDPKAGDAKAEQKAANRSEHIVYIPYTKLNDVFGKDPRQVVLSFSEYQRLWETVRKIGATIANPPIPAVISSIEYTGRLEGDVAAIQATLVVDVLTDEWVKMPVRFPSASISKVEGGTLAANEPGSYWLVLQKRGPHRVTLTMAAPLTRSANGRQLVLDGPLAGSTSLNLTIPERNLDVEVAPTLATKQITEQADATRVNIVAGAAERLTVSWRSKSETAVAETLATATNHAQVVVGDGVVQTHAAIEFKVLRGELSTLKFSLPAGERLLDIQAKALRDWRVDVADNRQVVTVRLHAPVKDGITLQVDSERPIPQEAFLVGTIRAEGVQRETGVLAVSSAEDIELTVVDRQGLTRIAAGEAPQPLQRAGAQFYKFYTTDYQLSIRSAPLATRFQVENRTLIRLEESRLRGECNLRFDIQRGGLFSVSVRLPEGIDLDEVTGPEVERHEVLTEGMARTLTIHLKQKTTGAFDCRIAYSQLRSDPNAALQLPLPEPVGAAAERGWVVLLAHESFEVNNDADRTKGVRPATLQELANQKFAPPGEPRMRTAAAFQFLTRPVDIGFSIQKRKTRLVADSFTFLDVKENAVRTQTTIVFDVQFAGTDTLQLAVPEEIANLIEITGPNIKEKRRGAAADGLVPWTIVLHTTTLGRHPIHITYNRPLALSEGQSGSVTSAVQLVRPVGVEHEAGQIAVAKDQALSLESKHENLEPIDPRQISIPQGVDAAPLQQAQLQLAYRYYRHPTRLDLTLTKHAVQRVIETVLSRTLVDAVVPVEGSVTYRVRYLLRSSQRQRLRLYMPAGAKFLGVNVAGRNILPEKTTDQEPVQGYEGYLINVARPSDSNDAFAMTVLYELPQSAKSLDRRSFLPTAMPTLGLAFPQFLGDVSMQRLFLRVWLPKRYVVTDTPPGFDNENESQLGVDRSNNRYELAQWENDWNQSAGQGHFEFPTVGTPYTFSTLVGRPVVFVRYGYRPVMVLAAAGTAIVVALIVLRMPFAWKLTLVLLATLAAIVGTIFDPVGVERWVEAALPGVGIGLAVWLVHGVARLRWSRTPTVANVSTAVPVVILLALLGFATPDDAAAQEFRHIYIPVDDLDVLLDSQKGVLLSKPEFLDLWNKAHPAGKPIEPRRDDLLLTKGDYTGTVVGETLQLVGRLELVKRTTGWKSIPLTLSGVSVLTALVGDAPAKLGQGSDGTLALFVSEPGTHRLQLELSTPLAQSRNGPTAFFQLPSAPGELVLTAPAGRQVRLAGVAVARAADANQFRVPLGGQGGLHVELRPAAEAAQRTALVFVRSQSTISLSPSQATLHDEITVEASAQPIDLVNIAVPESVQVIDIQAPGLSRWDRADGQVTVRFESPWTGTRAITIRALAATVLNDPWPLPHLGVREASVHGGKLTVRFDSTLISELRSVELARRLSPANVQEDSVQLAFWRPDYEAVVRLRPKVRQLAASLVSMVNVAQNRLELTSSVNVEPRDGSLFDLPIELPAGWHVTAMETNGQRLIYQTSDVANRRRYLVRLPEPVSPGQTATLTITGEQTPEQWLEAPGDVEAVELPTVTIPDATDTEGMILLRSAAEIQLATGQLNGLESTPVAGVPNADELVRVALQYRTGGQISGQLQATLQPAQIIARIDAVAQMTNTNLDVHYEVEYRVERGAANSLEFELPDMSENLVQVAIASKDSGGATFVRQSTRPAGQGRRRWLLQFDRNVRGPMTALIDIQLARADADSMLVPVLTVPNAIRQSGTVAVEAADDQQVVVASQQLREIDPSELPALLRLSPAGRLVAAYQFRQPTFQLGLQVTRHPAVDVLAGLCRNAQITSLIDNSGDVLSQAVYMLDNTGVQTLSVVLPAGHTLLSALQDGRPVEVRGAGGDYLISLPTSRADAAHVRIDLFYRGQTDADGLGRRLSQTPPKLNVTVLQLDWTVYLPEDRFAVRSVGAIRPTEPLQRESLIGEVRRALTPAGGRRFFNPFELFAPLAGERATRTFTAVSESIGGAGAQAPRTPANVEPMFELSEQSRAYSQKADDGLKDLSDEKEGHSFSYQARNRQLPKRRLQTGVEPKAAAPARPERYAMPGMAGMGALSADKKEAGVMGPRDAFSAQDPAAGGVLAVPPMPAPAAEPPVAKSEPAEPKSEARQLGDGRDQAWMQGYSASGRFDGERVNEWFRQAGGQAQGLLSVAMALETVGRPYKFQGLSGQGELAIDLGNHRVANLLVAAVAVGLMLLGWVAREASRGKRFLFLVLLFVVSIGLSGVVPLDWLFALDGMFLGAMGTWLLYIGRSISRLPLHKTAPAAATSAALLFAFTLQAQEAKQASNVLAGELPTIFVPYSPSQNPLDSQQVFLPQEEYQELWNAAYPDRVLVADPEISGLVTQARYSGRIEAQSARFEAQMTIWVFRDDWVAVPLPISGVVFRELLVDGKPAAVSGDKTPRVEPPIATKQGTLKGSRPVEGNGAAAKAADPAMPRAPLPVVYLRGRGQHSLKATFDAPVQRVGQTGELTLKLAPVGSARLEWMLPEAGLEVRATGLPGGWRLADRTVTAGVNAGGNIAIRWQPATNRQAADLLASVQQLTRVEIEESGVRLHSRFDYSVHQGTATQFSVRLPEPLRVVRVDSPKVADWLLEGNGAERKLIVRMVEPASGQVSIPVELFLPVGANEAERQADLELPPIVPLDVTREIGQIVVTFDPVLETGVRSERGLQQIGKQAFTGPAPSKGREPWPILAAYRYGARPIELAIASSMRTGRRSAQVHASVVISSNRVQWKGKITLEQAGAPLVAGRIRLPRGFVLDELAVPGNVRWKQLPEEAGTIIELEQSGLSEVATPQPSTIVVGVDGWVSRDAELMTLSIPEVQVLDTPRQQGYLAIFFAPGYDAQTTTVRGFLPVEPAGLPEPLRVVQSGTLTLAPRFAFRQESADTELALALRKLQPRLGATVATTVSVREVAVAYITQIRWQIEQAGVRRFEFTAPAWLGRDLDISGASIRQVESTEQAGTRRFQVELDREVVGDFRLNVVQILPLPEDALIRLPRVVPQNVEAFVAYALLENLSPDQLDRTASADLKLEDVRPEQIPLELSPSLTKRAVEMLHLLSQEGELAWRMRSSEQIAALTASVNLVELTMVVDATGEYRAQLNLRVSNRNEQFLQLVFPAGSRIWSAFVAGKPSRPALTTRQGQDIVLVPLPKTAAGDFSSQVQIVYAGTLGQTAGWWRTWHFPSPDILDLPVAETQWTLYLPGEFNYTSFQGNLEETEPVYLSFNRKATELREATQLLSQANFGRGTAKSRAIDNLLNFDAALSGEAARTEKGQRLAEQVQTQADQLNREIDKLRSQAQQAAPDVRQVELNDYFAPLQVEELRKEADERKEKAESLLKSQSAEPQAVRSKLRAQVDSQAAVLNQMEAKRGLSGERAPEAVEQEVAQVPALQQLDRGRAALVPPVTAAAEPEPTRPGGLSLVIELPKAGEPFHFVKVRGQPTLSAVIIPASASEWFSAAIWLVVCLAVGTPIGLAASKPAFASGIAAHWPSLLLLIGAIWWLILPLSAIGFFVMVLGMTVALWRLVRSRRLAAATA